MNNQSYAPTTRKLFFQCRKTEILECLVEVKVRIKAIEKNNKSLNKVAQVSEIYFRRFYARTNFLKAKLFTAIEDESEALSSI